MNRLVFALALTPLLIAAHPAAKVSPGQRVSALVVYGDDPCPAGAPDEVVVCARQPESERYRIPKPLRTHAYNAARDGSWAGTAQVLEATSRQAIPGSCSANGSWGQTGCFDQAIAQAGAERRAQAQTPPQ